MGFPPPPPSPASSGAGPSVLLGMISPDSSAGIDSFTPITIDISAIGVPLSDTRHGGPFTCPAGGIFKPFLSPSGLNGATLTLDSFEFLVSNAGGTQKIWWRWGVGGLSLVEDVQNNVPWTPGDDFEHIGVDLQGADNTGLSVQSTAGGQFFVQMIPFLTYTA